MRIATFHSLFCPRIQLLSFCSCNYLQAVLDLSLPDSRNVVRASERTAHHWHKTGHIFADHLIFLFVTLTLPTFFPRTASTGHEKRVALLFEHITQATMQAALLCFVPSVRHTLTSIGSKSRSFDCCQRGRNRSKTKMRFPRSPYSALISRIFASSSCGRHC